MTVYILTVLVSILTYGWLGFLLFLYPQGANPSGSIAFLVAFVSVLGAFITAGLVYNIETSDKRKPAV